MKFISVENNWLIESTAYWYWWLTRHLPAWDTCCWCHTLTRIYS